MAEIWCAAGLLVVHLMVASWAKEIAVTDPADVGLSAEKLPALTTPQDDLSVITL